MKKNFPVYIQWSCKAKECYDTYKTANMFVKKVKEHYIQNITHKTAKKFLRTSIGYSFFLLKCTSCSLIAYFCCGVFSWLSASTAQHIDGSSRISTAGHNTFVAAYSDQPSTICCAVYVLVFSEHAEAASDLTKAVAAV